MQPDNSGLVFAFWLDNMRFSKVKGPHSSSSTCFINSQSLINSMKEMLYVQIFWFKSIGFTHTRAREWERAREREGGGRMYILAITSVTQHLCRPYQHVAAEQAKYTVQIGSACNFKISRKEKQEQNHENKA